MLEMRERLIKRFLSLEDRVEPGETIDEACARFEGLLWLIGWCERNPEASRAQYLEQVKRVRQHGVPRAAEVRVQAWEDEAA